MKVVKVRNVFKPRWWQIRRRYHIWKALRHAAKIRADLSLEEQVMLDKMENDFEHRILFGKKDAD